MAVTECCEWGGCVLPRTGVPSSDESGSRMDDRIGFQGQGGGGDDEWSTPPDMGSERWRSLGLPAVHQGWLCDGSGAFTWAGGLDEPFAGLVRRVGALPDTLMPMLTLAVEVFTLSGGRPPLGAMVERVWAHSLRVGYLAARIAESRSHSPLVTWQAFVGGVLHDIGVLVLLSQESPSFLTVVEQARRRSVDLRVLERSYYGTTHAELGAAFLARWGGDEVLVRTVKYHDDPPENSGNDFSPAAAVFLANFLDGGGLPQDSDGVLGGKGEEYVCRMKLWDQLPSWQVYVRTLRDLFTV